MNRMNHPSAPLRGPANHVYQRISIPLDLTSDEPSNCQTSFNFHFPLLKIYIAIRARIVSAIIIA